MNRWPIILLFVLSAIAFGGDAPESVILPGEVIVAKARVRNCEDWGEFTVDYGIVGFIEERQVIILDHVLPAAGLLPSEFEANLEQAVAQRIGRPPTTLHIEVLAEEAFVERQWEIEAEIRKYYEAIKACDRKMDEFRTRAKDVANSNAIQLNSTVRGIAIARNRRFESFVARRGQESSFSTPCATTGCSGCPT